MPGTASRISRPEAAARAKSGPPVRARTPGSGTPSRTRTRTGSRPRPGAPRSGPRAMPHRGRARTRHDRDAAGRARPHCHPSGVCAAPPAARRTTTARVSQPRRPRVAALMCARHCKAGRIALTPRPRGPYWNGGRHAAHCSSCSPSRWPALARADEVFLKSGGRLSGQVVSEDGRSVVLEVGPGRVSVPAASVLRIERST